MAKYKDKLDLDKVIQEMDFGTLLQLSAENRNKRKAFSFLEYFKKKDHDMTKIISGLTKLLFSCMEENLSENGKTNWTTADAEKCKRVIEVILVIVDIALVSLKLSVSDHCQVELALMLNGILREIPSNQDNIRNYIAVYCEKLYAAANNVERAEYFLFNVLPYLFQRTLRKKPIKSDVKRIYNIRNLIKPILELKESSSEELWDLFKKCAIQPIYLSIIEGQKVVGMIMTLDIDEVAELHKIIREHLATVNVKTAEAYGRVYFEAWCFCIKTGSLDVKNVIEITCLQDFLLLAIQTRHRPFLPLVRKLLSQFHSHKKEIAVSKMLYSLYQPILYRFLKNPDGQTRANAAQLFLDIFPLEDPDEKIVTTDLELNDQLLMIRDLLVDDFPIVRITAILGICVSMSVNWEVFPEEMLKTYFRILVDDLSRDSSSAEVRCAVVKGIKCLLENPLTMNCLVSILPKLQGLFHDNSENVRIAFCQLLLKVKKISAIKYFHVVPTKHLFARLEEDSHAVKKAITSLLNNSYFPRQEDPKIWMGRCLEIIKNEQGASRVFFTYVSNFIGVENSIKFMIQAAKAVHFYVKTKQSSPQIESGNKENIVNYQEYLVSLEEAVGFNNYNIVSTVMDCITVMWLSLKGDIEKPENKCYLKMLVQKLGRPLQELCLYYKDTEAWESVFYVSSYLPPALVPCLASLCFFKLKNLPSDAKAEKYMVLLECLCNQRQGSGLLNLLKDWIEAGLSESYVQPPAKRRRKSRGKVDIPRDEPKPYLATRMLESMLGHRMLQKNVTENYVEDLRGMLFFVDLIKKKIEAINARFISEAEASFLSVLMYNLLKISVFVHDEKLPGGVPFVNEVVLWTDQKLVRHLVFSLEITDHFTNLIFTICKNLCKIVADATGLDFIDPSSRTYLVLFEKLLRLGMGYRFALITSRFLYKHATSAQYLYLCEGDTVMTTNMLSSILKIFDCFCDDAFLESIPSQELKEIEFTLANVMQVIHNHVALLIKPTSLVFKCIIKNIFDSLVTESTKIAEDLTDVNFVELTFPTVGSFFMILMTYKPALLPTYIKFFNEFYESHPKGIAFWIACWAIVHRVLDVKTLPREGLRELRIVVFNLEKTLNEIFPRRKSQESASPTAISSVPNQMFQRHCYAEFFTLKSNFSKLLSARNSQR